MSSDPSKAQELMAPACASASLEQRAIAVRIPIPLYFIKFYLHLSLVRDTRVATRLKEQARALLGKTLGGLFLFYLTLVIFLPLLFLALYMLKSWLGIDLFADRHLSDFFI